MSETPETGRTAPGGALDTVTTRVILLAGGRGQRLGGADKALLRRTLPAQASGAPGADQGGTTLLSQWCSALAARGISGVVVGDPALHQHLTPAAAASLKVTQEDPPFSGPAAAVCAGMRALPAETQHHDGAMDQPWEQVLLSAVDIAEPAPLLDWLLDNACPAPTEPGQVGLLPHDGQGRAQWLASVIHAGWLRRRVAMIPPGAEQAASLRWLLGTAPLRHLKMPQHLGADIDDPDQARRFGIQL